MTYNDKQVDISEYDYQQYIREVYDKYLKETIKNFDELITNAHKIYYDIHQYNQKKGITKDKKDDVLIYYIACYIIQLNKYKKFLSNYKIAELAYKISIGL